MTGLLACLVGGVFLGARIEQDVAQAGRQRERTLLAMQQVGDRPVDDVVGESDFLAVVQAVAHRAPQLDDRVQRHDRRQGHVKRLVEVDVALVEWVPDMVVSGRNDAVEGIGPAAIPWYFQHCREVLARDGVVGFVVRDLLGHRSISKGSLNMTGASPFSMDFSPVPAHVTSAIFRPPTSPPISGRYPSPAQE